MPENAGRKFGKGELYQHNVLNLVKALLRLAKEDLRLEDSRLKAAVQVAWVAQDKLKVTGEYKEITKRGERLFEGTTKQDLWQLVEKTGTPLQLPQRQRDDTSTSAASRQADVVQNALYYLEDLGVLQDERPENKRNTKYWIFTLTLKHTDASIEENLGVVKQKLGLEMSPPTDKSIDWRDICLAMLEKQKRLTTNELLSADEDMKFELDDIHVPLALVQRTKPDKRSGDVSPEEGSRLLQPTYEEKQRFRHEEFLAQVLQEGKGQSKGRRIAVIGEPGAGKTTLLQSIAFWLFEDKNKNLGLPIWISLADLQGKTLEEYLRQRWLKNALEVVRVTPEQENVLVELFKNNRVWLFLDGIDEISGDSVSVGANGRSPLQAISSQLEGWVARARVVLSCRLNVWEANLNALGDDFETYRLLDFDYPLQVKEFICRWFRKTDADKGERLWAELDKSERQRIQDLVKNPLRLALLCSTWQSSDQGLPSTKAGLYERFLKEFYKWKENRFPITEDQQEELNAALGRLAKRAIDQDMSRFRLQHKLVREELGDPKQQGSLFWLALQLGWLNQVGLAAESEIQEKVYAFYHPTFQEYFAALAIPHWEFFLSHNNDNPNPSQQYNGKPCVYRIFNLEWKEVILLWLGRPDTEVNKEEKDAFINALVRFNDGCEGFYRYRAYFLAAAGIAEFRNCKIANRIVSQLVETDLGYFCSERQQPVSFLAPIRNGARAALRETDRQRLIIELNKQLNSQDDRIQCQVALSLLLEYESCDNHQAIKVLNQLLNKSQNNWIVGLSALGLLECNPENKDAITSLTQLYKQVYKLDCELSDFSIPEVLSWGRIWYGVHSEHTYGIRFFQKQGYYRNEESYTKKYVPKQVNEKTRQSIDEVDSLIHLLQKSQDSEVCCQIICRLKEIESTNPDELTTLIALVNRLKLLCSDLASSWKLLSTVINRSQDWCGTANYRDQEIIIEIIPWQESLSKLNAAIANALIKIVKDCLCNPPEFSYIGVVGELQSFGIANLDTYKILIDVIKFCPDQDTREQAILNLKNMLRENWLRGSSFERELFKVLVQGLKNFLDIANETNQIIQRDCFSLIWYCAQNMTYPDFYEAWHPQEGVEKTSTSDSQSLNQADLRQSLQSAIANNPQLSQTIHLICIDGSQFIEPNRPATEIYDQMLDQNCPECDPVPETMPALKLCWNSLKRKSDKRPFLVFYASFSHRYSEAFLTALSKFGREICVIAEQHFNHIPLKFFAPSQTIEDVVQWIRQKVLEK